MRSSPNQQLFRAVTCFSDLRLPFEKRIMCALFSLHFWLRRNMCNREKNQKRFRVTLFRKQGKLGFYSVSRNFGRSFVMKRLDGRGLSTPKQKTHVTIFMNALFSAPTSPAKSRESLAAALERSLNHDRQATNSIFSIWLIIFQKSWGTGNEGCEGASCHRFSPRRLEQVLSEPHRICDPSWTRRHWRVGCDVHREVVHCWAEPSRERRPNFHTLCRVPGSRGDEVCTAEDNNPSVHRCSYPILELAHFCSRISGQEQPEEAVEEDHIARRSLHAHASHCSLSTLPQVCGFHRRSHDKWLERFQHQSQVATYPMIISVNEGFQGIGKIKVNNHEELCDVEGMLQIMSKGDTEVRKARNVPWKITGLQVEVQPFIDAKYDLHVQKIGHEYKTFIRRGICKHWKSNVGSSVLEQIATNERWSSKRVRVLEERFSGIRSTWKQ